MPSFRPVCRAEELVPGAGRLIEIDGKAIALFNVDGSFHAIEDHCLHAGGPLHEGHLEGQIVMCPWHGWRFDLANGACEMNPKVSLHCYPVRVRDGSVEVRV